MSPIVIALLIVALVAGVIAAMERQAWPWLMVAVILIAIALLLPNIPALASR